jgi:hypothetical protein
LRFFQGIGGDFAGTILAVAQIFGAPLIYIKSQHGKMLGQGNGQWQAHIAKSDDAYIWGRI